MRKTVMGSTAFIAALASASYARADLDVNVGGFARAEAGFFDNKFANQTGRDFRYESEIHINASGKSESGMEYGAKIELETSTDSTINSDETSLYLGGNWGRAIFGDEDGASDQLSVFAPTVGIGQIDGRYLLWVNPTSRPAGNAQNTGGGIFKPMDSDDSTKVTYYTPRYMGLQAGASYAPELGPNGDGEGVEFTESGSNERDTVESALNYTNTYDSGVRVNASAAYVHADATPASGREDISAWGLGLRLGYKEFELGGGYVDNGDSSNTAGTADDDETAFNGGLKYQTGPFGAAISFLHEDYDDNGGRGTTTGGGTYQSVVLGSTYTVAQGLTTSADLAFFERNFDTGTDDKGYVLVLETKAVF